VSLFVDLCLLCLLEGFGCLVLGGGELVVSGFWVGVWDLGFWDFWSFRRDLDLERRAWWDFLRGLVGCR
jgi:hypothetical protein